MTKKHVSFLLTIILLFILLPFTVTARDMQAEVPVEEDVHKEEDILEDADLEYEFSITQTDENFFQFNKDTGTITGYIGTEVNVVIPERIQGVTVKKIGDRAFKEKGLQSVIIPNSVTSIGNDAFSHNQLKEVNIPNSVIDIGESGFQSNQLTKVVLSNNMTTIKLLTFADNQLENVSVPKSVIRIGQAAFYMNPIEYISTPKNIENIVSDSIPPSAIIIAEENSAAHSWAVKNGMAVQLVGKTATFNLKGGEGYFPDHTVSLENPLIKPKAIPIKEGAVFKNWRTDNREVYDFRTITGDITILAGWEESIQDEGAFQFDKDTGTITGYIGTEVNVVIPERIDGVTVKKIGDRAFKEKGLQSVIIPNTVTSIGDSAFMVNQLLSIVIPDSVTSIGNHAFQANQLTKVSLPNNLTRINLLTFAGNQLKNVIIPESVIKIDEMAFYFNPLEYISLPRNTEIIGAEAVPSSAIIITEENSTAHKWALNSSRSVQLVGRIASFDLKGGEGSFPSHTIKPGEPLVKPITVPTKENTVFKKWRTNTESDYDFKTITGNITIFAEWEEELSPATHQLLPVLSVHPNKSFSTLVYDPNQLLVGTFTSINSNGITGSLTGVRINSMGEEDENGSFTKLQGMLNGEDNEQLVEVKLSTTGLSLYVRMYAVPALDGQFDVHKITP
ncbi:MAG TPA: leucine-rich repeat protein [Bacillus bacterium]|nr:leucine-rich repeat protein [Bacillus sp. (in: firmicutes)]